MKRAAWSKSEVEWFLAFTDHHTAPELARRSGRTKAAIEGMRRKLKRLRELGVSDHRELVQLMGAVNEGFVQTHRLPEIRMRAEQPGIIVRPFMRHGIRCPKRHLVAAHVRQPQGA